MTSKLLWFGIFLGIALSSGCNKSENTANSTTASVTSPTTNQTQPVTVSPSIADTAIKEFISITNDAADNLGKVKDQKSADEAIIALKSDTKKVEELSKTLKGLGKISPEEDQHLKQNNPKVLEAFNRFGKTSTKLTEEIPDLPVSPETRKNLGKALEDFSQALGNFGQAAKGLTS